MRAPIFIIGYPRSGTSFVGKLVGKFTGYPSHGESHASTLLQEVIHQINLYRSRKDFTGKELVKELDLEALQNINLQFFRDFYLRTYGTERFIDKTPGSSACHGWGVVKQMFPSACFIGCVRSPVEVYESALQKFGGREGVYGDVDIIKVAEGWVGAMRGIEKLVESAFAGDLHVVSQLDLRASPGNVVSSLFRFLGVPDQEITKGVEFCSRSRDDVLTKTIEQPSYKTLSKLEIPMHQAEMFHELCAATCERWSISL